MTYQVTFKSGKKILIGGVNKIMLLGNDYRFLDKNNEIIAILSEDSYINILKM